MTVLTSSDAMITAQETERADVLRLAQLLVSPLFRPVRLVGADGTATAIPEVALRVLETALEALASDQPVVIMPASAYLATKLAAEFLNVEHNYLLRLLDAGDLQSSVFDGERRVNAGDLARYKAQRRAHERQGLSELARLSEDLGLYDTDAPTVIEE